MIPITNSIPVCFADYWFTIKLSVINEGILPGMVPVKRRKSPQKNEVQDGRESSEDEGGDR